MNRKKSRSSSRRVSRLKPRGKSARDRTAAHREEVETFLITCEGEKTEPNYFRKFRVPHKVIQVEGLGDHTLSLVKKTLALKKEGDYDQVWVVFDRDSFPKQRFNSAIELARNENIRVAYSNEAFELWYLLHFHYYDTGLSRKAYSGMLTKLLGYTYRKNSETIYDDLLDKQEDAIHNAKKLLVQYAHPNPERDNPSTTVHQ